MTRNEWASLNPQEKRIKISKLCGWALVRGNVTGWGKMDESPDGDRLALRHPNGSYYENSVMHLPDYLNDLNAMHEAELACIRNDDNKQGGYIQNLRDIQIGHETTSGKLAFATAAQRAEAFAMTMDAKGATDASA